MHIRDTVTVTYECSAHVSNDSLKGVGAVLWERKFAGQSQTQLSIKKGAAAESRLLRG